MSDLTSSRYPLLPAITAGFVAVLVGYTSSAAIIFQAVKAAGATDAQLGGWLTMLGIAMGITSLGLSLRYKVPVLTAWSTPGAALLVTSLPGTTLNEAVGIFVFTSALTLFCAVTGLFARIMNLIPGAISSAMLAGILLRFGLEAFASFQFDLPLACVMCLTWLLARRWQPRYAILLTLVAGLVTACAQGRFGGALPAIHIAWPVWTTPHFTLASLLSIGLPYFLVTLASQNAPGIATLNAFNYAAPTSSLMGWTSLTSLLLAPLGGFSVCIAAITAAICMGPDVHPDKRQRWQAAAAAGCFYLLAGLFGGAIGLLFTLMPATLIHLIAGLALLNTIGSSLQQALENVQQRDAALVTFLVTASGLTLAGMGAAFWGLLAGMICWIAQRKNVTTLTK
ncbi:hypothetical protein CIG19_17865 [Enterobacterales bacterium CwR94]|nr:hypothetical protein CIG19_17865 [Enterobacterales bacterium CwR94]